MIRLIVLLACVGAALGAAAIELFGRSLEPTGPTPHGSAARFRETVARVKGMLQSRTSTRSKTSA